jgi:hypothetical protein
MWHILYMKITTVCSWSLVLIMAWCCWRNGTKGHKWGGPWRVSNLWCSDHESDTLTIRPRHPLDYYKFSSLFVWFQDFIRHPALCLWIEIAILHFYAPSRLYFSCDWLLVWHIQKFSRQRNYNLHQHNPEIALSAGEIHKDWSLKTVVSSWSIFGNF